MPHSMAVSPTGPNSSAWGLTSSAAPKHSSAGMVLPSAAYRAHSAMNSASTASIWPQAALLAMAAGLKAIIRPSSAAPLSLSLRRATRHTSTAPARSASIGISFSRMR